MQVMIPQDEIFQAIIEYTKKAYGMWVSPIGNVVLHAKHNKFHATLEVESPPQASPPDRREAVASDRGRGAEASAPYVIRMEGFLDDKPTLLNNDRIQFDTIEQYTICWEDILRVMADHLDGRESSDSGAEATEPRELQGEEKDGPEAVL